MEIERSLILVGIIIILLGIFLTINPKIPVLGKLPGDISYHSGNFSFYFPLTTSIIISIILSIVFNLFK